MIHAPLGRGRERSRRGQLEEDPELQLRYLHTAGPESKVVGRLDRADELAHRRPSKEVMKRAAELFNFERRPSCSPYVQEFWHTRSVAEESFISVAAYHWEIVVTRQSGAAVLTVRGPETTATTVPIPTDAEFFGIQFTLGTFMPSLPPGRLVDRSVVLPQVSSAKFWLDGTAWELPEPHTVDVFVDRLVDDGLLVHDAVALRSVGGLVVAGT